MTEEKKDWVLIIDDSDESREIAGYILEHEGIRVTKLSSGREALDYLEGMMPLPDLILLDLIMPEMNGFEVLRRLRERNDAESRIPVIMLTADDDKKSEVEGLREGAEDYILKPFVPEILILRVRRTIELSRFRNDLAKEVALKTRENSRLVLHVVQTLAEAIDAKDSYTNGHSGRVAAYAREIAKRLGYSEDETDAVYMMGLLHDVGKIGVPDEIINKPARLTDEEFARIKEHPVTGERILRKIKETPRLCYGARWHHERVDGRGYPDGLKGDEIPEEARIIAVADAYDAMTSNRSYRDVLDQSVVRGEIEKGKGKQFDERIADVMLSLIDEDKGYIMREGAAEEAGLKEKSEAETAKGREEAEVLPGELSDIPGLDTETGLYLCGDVEDYMDALSIFVGSISSKSEKLEQAFQEEDIISYTTLVHSLKSSARTVGAIEVSDLAKRLETAGKQGDLAEIKLDTPLLLAKYRKLKDSLEGVVEEADSHE